MTDTQQQPKPQTAAQRSFDDLSGKLASCETVTEVYRLAESEAFSDAAHKLPADLLIELRGVYKQRLNTLDGRVRLADFDGKPIVLVGINYWHSDRYNEGATGGEGVTLVFHPEDDLKKTFKASTSSSVVVRFANSISRVPSETDPLRIVARQVPVSDAERAAKGQKRWDIQRLPSGGSRPETPF